MDIKQSQFKPDLDRLKVVRNSKSNDLEALSRIADLNPRKDFRYADLRGVDWEGSDKSRFDLSHSAEGDDFEMNSEKISKLMKPVVDEPKWQQRLDGAVRLLEEYGYDKDVSAFLEQRLVKDKAVSFTKGLAVEIQSRSPKQRDIEYTALWKRLRQNGDNYYTLEALFKRYSSRDDVFNFGKSVLLGEQTQFKVSCNYMLWTFSSAYQQETRASNVLYKLAESDELECSDRAFEFLGRYFFDEDRLYTFLISIIKRGVTISKAVRILELLVNAPFDIPVDDGELTQFCNEVVHSRYDGTANLNAIKLLLSRLNGKEHDFYEDIYWGLQNSLGHWRHTYSDLLEGGLVDKKRFASFVKQKLNKQKFLIEDKTHILKFVEDNSY